MAKMEIEGLEEYGKALEALGEKSDEIVKQVVYKGGGIMADAIKAGLKTIPVEEGPMKGLPPYGTPENPIEGISRLQKGELLDAFGVSPIQKFSNDINVKIGFDGYSKIKTKKYPKGIPLQLIARSVESGTSFRKKFPVIRKAVNRTKKKMLEIMEQEADKLIKKEIGG